MLSSIVCLFLSPNPQLQGGQTSPPPGESETGLSQGIPACAAPCPPGIRMSQHPPQTCYLHPLTATLTLITQLCFQGWHPACCSTEAQACPAAFPSTPALPQKHGTDYPGPWEAPPVLGSQVRDYWFLLHISGRTGGCCLQERTKRQSPVEARHETGGTVSCNNVIKSTCVCLAGGRHFSHQKSCLRKSPATYTKTFALSFLAGKGKSDLCCFCYK